MGFFDIGAKKSQMPGEQKSIATYMLTPAGKLKLKNLSGSEPEFAVLASILQAQPATMDEVAEGSQLGYNKAKHVMGQLIAKEWVMRAGARGEQ